MLAEPGSRARVSCPEDVIRDGVEELQSRLEVLRALRSPWLTSSTRSRARGIDFATRPPISTAIRISPPSHVGRLYLDVGAIYFTCSANAIASPNGMTVATAAHCTEGDDGPATTMLFVPGYEDGRSPYGEWPVSSFITGPG